jgi:hypothetical protein
MVRAFVRDVSRLERHSDVHAECDGIGRGRTYWAVEPDGKVRLDKVGLEQAAVLDGNTVVNQGGKAPRWLIDDERHPSSHRDVVSHTPQQTRMNRERRIPRRRGVDLGNEF